MDEAGKKRIGQILCEKGYLNQSRLEQALAEQQKSENRQFGEILLDLGYITRDQLDEGLRLQGKGEDSTISQSREGEEF